MSLQLNKNMLNPINRIHLYSLGSGYRCLKNFKDSLKTASRKVKRIILWKSSRIVDHQGSPAPDYLQVTNPIKEYHRNSPRGRSIRSQMTQSSNCRLHRSPFSPLFLQKSRCQYRPLPTTHGCARVWIGGWWGGGERLRVQRGDTPGAQMRWAQVQRASRISPCVGGLNARGAVIIGIVAAPSIWPREGRCPLNDLFSTASLAQCAPILVSICQVLPRCVSWGSVCIRKLANGVYSLCE